MEFVVVILVIALIAAVAYIVMQRRPGGARGLGRPRTGPVVRRPRGARRDPMTTAVVDHIEATGDHEVVAAEQRLREEARRVAAPIQAEHDRREHQRVANQLSEPDTSTEPDPYVDPRDDPRR